MTGDRSMLNSHFTKRIKGWSVLFLAAITCIGVTRCGNKIIYEPPPYVLAGQVTDSLTTIPLSGAVFSYYSNLIPAFDSTDSSGAYRIVVGVEPKSTFFVGKTGYRTKQVEHSFTSPDRVDTVNIRLAPL